jgi:hypothetical protein
MPSILYKTGLISIEAGSRQVIGNSAAIWLAADIRQGDILKIDGHALLYFIEQRVDVRELLLDTDFAGPSVVNGTYAILRMSGDWGSNRVLALQVGELIRQIDTDRMTQEALDAALATATANIATMTTLKDQTVTAQTQAIAARDKAQKWADESVDVAVEPSKFSAKHHATKANASETNAATSAAAAAGSANSAATSLTNVNGAISALGLPETHVSNNMLRRKADNSGLEYRTPAQVKTDIGLGNVDNTSDANKPVSTAQQTALNLKENAANKGQPNGYAGLDGSGKVPSSQLPALALTDVYEVANQAAQLALAAQEGDVAIRSDQNKSYIHNGGTAGTMADWSELKTPTDLVLSVAGKTGAVTLVKADVGLGSVDNTSDANKPVSTAQQAALDQKAPKGLLSGGAAQSIFTANGNIAAADNGKIVIGNSAVAITLTTSNAATLGAGFFVIVYNFGNGDLTITPSGAFDDGEASIVLEKGQSMVLTSNGTQIRKLLRGGGAGGGGSVIPLRETLTGNGGAVYMLANTPASKDAMLVFVGGVPQSKANFEIAGNQLTLGGNVAADEKIEVLLLKGGAAVVGVAPLYRKNAGTGSAGPFTLQAAPTVNEALTITWNGLIQPKDGSAYTVVGDQITFSESIPVGTYWEEIILQPVGIGVPNPESVGATQIKEADKEAINTKLGLGSLSAAVLGSISAVGGFFSGVTNNLKENYDTYWSGNKPIVNQGWFGTLGSFRSTWGWNGFRAAGNVLKVLGINGSSNVVYAELSDDGFVVKGIAGVVDGQANFNGNQLFRVPVNGDMPSFGSRLVFERGSNGNGDYVKFADGTMICWITAGSDMTATTTAVGSGYQAPSTSSYTFPAAFTSAPTVTATALFSSVSRGWLSLVSITTSAVSLMPHSFVSGALLRPHIVAVGRWF